MKTIVKRSLHVGLCLTGAVGVAACGDPAGAGDPDEPVGSAVLHVGQVPAGVLCLQVEAKGATRTETRSFDLTPGATGVSLPVSRLPVGAVEFMGRAYGAACSAVTATDVPDYVSDPTIVTIQLRAVPDVLLNMKRNGQADVSVDWEDGPAACTPINVALNAVTAESDPGWGGGSQPYEMVDGLTCYPDWPHGHAFTGGTGNWMGEPCGWRQATVDFGKSRRLTGIVDVHHHGGEHVPTTVRIEVFEAGAWSEVFSTTDARSFTLPDTCPVGSTPMRHDIGARTASKLRYWLNNCDITHGWIYELAVEGCQ